MDKIEPLCLSQYFVNKQNVRSFGNIVKSKILKADDSSFAQQVLQDQDLVRQTSTEINTIFKSLRNNLRICSKDDFRNYFSEIEKSKFLTPINKDIIFKCCWNAIYVIIPKQFFGSNHNAKVFRKIVKTVTFSMRRQHIIISNTLEKWDTSVSPWDSIPSNISRLFVNKIILWILKNVLSAILSLNFYITTCKLDADENKLYFFWRNQWQSFYDKKISNMVVMQILKKYEAYCLGKQVKINHSLQERLRLRNIKKEIPKLHLILKSGNDCRPIVRYKQDLQTQTEKYKMKDRFHILKTLTGKHNQKIELQYNIFYREWVKMNKPKLYFVKTDLSNAFGSINREKLMKILSERHMSFQKNENNLLLKKKIAQYYKELVSELRKPLLVRAGSTVYEWQEGLVQGYKYSPALSELYYTHMDEIYFSNHLKEGPQLKLFMRVVDDYLYISDSIEDAHSFLEALTNYRNVNYKKTVTNFSYPNVESSHKISFLGYSYDTNTLQVSRANNVYVGQMCYKISFSPAIENLNKFLENRIGQSGIQINGHIFNLHHNNEETIWTHIFTTFCLSANKFCTILAILCDDRQMTNFVSLYKNRVAVKLCNSMLETLMRNKPLDVWFVYCINHLRYLAFKALYLCAVKTSKCSVLVPLINDEMAKCNCIFGKWKEHSSRIDSSGECKKKATREVCRRSDLRIIFKWFDVLPKGFECFNHKNISRN